MSKQQLIMDQGECWKLPHSLALAGSIALHSSQASLLTIHGGEGLGDLVSINRDGTLTYGPNYTPDTAAKSFWEAMARHIPRCPSCPVFEAP
jgi:hypothetical protein